MNSNMAVNTASLEAHWKRLYDDPETSKSPLALKLFKEVQRRARLRLVRLALKKCEDPLKCYRDGTPVSFFGRVYWTEGHWQMRPEYSVISS